jgi:hypothetical protein
VVLTTGTGICTFVRPVPNNVSSVTGNFQCRRNRHTDTVLIYLEKNSLLGISGVNMEMGTDGVIWMSRK